MLARQMQTFPEILTLPRGPVPVAWRQSLRARRVSLRIDARDGAVVITLPARAGRPAGMALLMDQAGWVADRLAALPGRVRFADGAVLPLGGRPVRIRHVAAWRRGRGPAWLERGELLVGGEAALLSRRVGEFLRNEARRRLASAALSKARAIAAPIRCVVVKDPSTRWGSCAADGTLMFSWRLVMAPPPVQDYAVAHEVAHLRHMDHGQDFWALVDGLTPHREAASAWLRHEGLGLLRVG